LKNVQTPKIDNRFLQTFTFVYASYVYLQCLPTKCIFVTAAVILINNPQSCQMRFLEQLPFLVLNEIDD